MKGNIVLAYAVCGNRARLGIAWQQPPAFKSIFLAMTATGGAQPAVLMYLDPVLTNNCEANMASSQGLSKQAGAYDSCTGGIEVGLAAVYTPPQTRIDHCEVRMSMTSFLKHRNRLRVLPRCHGRCDRFATLCKEAVASGYASKLSRKQDTRQAESASSCFQAAANRN
jgi:hypothetical protein